MLSEIERIFPSLRNNMRIDIDEILLVRKNRSKLFNEQYFTNKFWDIILLLYSHEVNDIPIDSSAIARHLELSRSSVSRYLTVLVNDDILCANDLKEEDCFDLARDNLSLTRRGFKNAGTIIQQTRRIYSSNTTV